MTTRESLRRVSLLHSIPDDMLDELAESSAVVRLAAGDHICREGDESHTMYVILDGSLQAYRVDGSGERVNLNSLGASELVGELALLDNQPRSASVVCLTPCTLLAVEQQTFLGLLENNPTLIRPVLTTLTDKLRQRIAQNYERELAKRHIQTQAELERYRSLSQMVAGVAHELNTPLGIANTASSIIRNRLDEPEVRAALGQGERTRSALEEITEANALLVRNLSRAHRLVQSFKKVSVDQVSDKLATVNLRECVEDVIDLFKINARQAGIEVELVDRLPTDQRTWIGYPGMLSQVLLNLLTNVERYAYPNRQGGKVMIELSVVEGAARATFQLIVQDFGKGIAKEHLSQVFDPFFTTGRAVGGTGLGMAIVHNLVTEAFNGRIEVASTLGEGVTVTIRFPQKLA